MDKKAIRSCMAKVKNEQETWAEKRGTTFGIMVDGDYLAIQYQRRVRLLVRLHYRLHPNLVPSSLCLVHMKDKGECACQ